jgi:hypothetical protein
MLNGHHKISDCGFGEQLVSYLYNEINGAEKSNFEMHLRNCAACADEFAAFSGVHYSINDWKLKDFSMLETPLIEVPSKINRFVETPELSENKSSWLSGLRRLFSLSPRAWSLATASFAILAVCVGIVFFVINHQKVDLVSQNNKKPIPSVSPTIEQPKVISTSETPENPPKPIVQPKNPTTDIVKDDSKTTRSVKVIDNSRQPKKVENADVRKNNEPKINNQTKAPKVVIEDEEDNSLRLAEMFDEIDTK